MNNLKIVLIGLPGSGKSTMGKELAGQLGFTFYDLDELISKKEGKPVSEIFYQEGEGFFRGLESQLLEEKLGSDEAFVLATGGGAPSFNDNMDKINRHAVSVFLDVPFDRILSRLTSGEIALRPLFQGLDMGEISQKLKNMYAARIPYYDQAKIKLSGEDISTELLMSELMTFFRS